MQSQQKETFVEVFETKKVKYKDNQFLFFKWFTKVCATKVRNDIVITTNDDIENIYFNGKLLTNNK